MNSIFEPVLDGLERHRRYLIFAYLLLLGIYCLAVASFGKVEGGSGLDYLIPTQESLAASELQPVVIFLSGLLLIQGLFLWGGGRLSIDKLPAGPWRLLIPVAIAAALMALLSGGLIITVLEMLDRYEGSGSLRENSEWFSDVLDIFKEDNGPWIFLAPVWILWFAIGMYMFRKADGQTALSRMTTTLLAGSWIEFLVALPVDIAIRQRAEDCPCDTGSWLALVVAIPVFLFAFGPGVLLLYLREMRLSRDQPKRAWKILVRKTRKRAGDPS